MTTPTNLAELIEVLQSLPARPPIQRASLVRSLATTVRAILGDVGEAAIFEAVHELDGVHKRTHREVAELLGVTPTTVNEAVTRYRKRHTAERRAAVARRSPSNGQSG